MLTVFVEFNCPKESNEHFIIMHTGTCLGNDPAEKRK